MANKAFPGTLKISDISCTEYGADSNISIKDGKVVVDGVEYPIESNASDQPIILVFNGDVGNLNIYAAPGEITVNGSVENIQLTGSAKLDFGQNSTANISCESVESTRINLRNGKITCNEMKKSTIQSAGCVKVTEAEECSIASSHVTAKNINGTVHSDNIQAKSINGVVEGQIKDCTVAVTGQVNTINYSHVTGTISECRVFRGFLRDCELSCNEFNGAAFARTGMDINCKNFNGAAIAGTGLDVNCETASGTFLAGTGINIHGDATGVLLASTGYSIGPNEERLDLVVPSVGCVADALTCSVKALSLVNDLEDDCRACFSNRTSSALAKAMDDKVDTAYKAIEAIRECLNS